MNFRSGFGFNPNIFSALAEKTKHMDSFSCHGGIVFDEMKLSEHLDVKSNGELEGFVDLAQFTSESQKEQLSDHGMVVLFQPFQGKWTQVLGVFASQSNVKADTLAKIIVEATILCEKAGLLVDYVTCDGASWNRSMWKLFGIRGAATSTRCKAPHPVDATRHLHFLSDFPHLIKNVRNAFVSKGFNTPEGRVHVGPIEEAWKMDSKSVSLKVMPKITSSHIRPNSFEKMRVAPAFQIFGDQIAVTIVLGSPLPAQEDHWCLAAAPSAEQGPRMERAHQVLDLSATPCLTARNSLDGQGAAPADLQLQKQLSRLSPVGLGADASSMRLRFVLQVSSWCIKVRTSAVPLSFKGHSRGLALLVTSMSSSIDVEDPPESASLLSLGR
ncbi:hypothetical protein HPB49_024750 [Dermacentor silvarum]|uniref:Uncharacterized protein n=1 Tax=Dermacentor silvarum TaxID=543639 RepID=A0ACB8C644_DERSI|nr:hypothetical protein HPB49_024750 [Dermacentor silvarum]